MAEAVTEIWQQVHDNLRVFIAKRVANDAEAEDIGQETYARAFTDLAAFRGAARFSTWLVRIAVYEALGRLRRARRVTSLDDAELDEEPSATTRNPEEMAGDIELRALLEDAVDALPVGFRAVFVMRAVEGMTVVETAEALDLPEETVRTRHFRARSLLRDDLAGQISRVAPQAFAFHLSRCDRVTASIRARIRRA